MKTPVCARAPQQFQGLVSLAVCTFFAGPLSAQPALAAPVHSHASMTRSRSASQYPKNWPKQIPIHILERDGSSITVRIKGPEYWRSLGPARRARLHNLSEFRRYAQADQGRTH